MIVEIIKTLREHEHLGAGDYVEIAKGKNEYITSFRDMKRKMKRLWHTKK